MQLPGPLHITIGADATAAGARPQTAFDAANANPAGASVHVNIAASRQVRLDLSTASAGTGERTPVTEISPEPEPACSVVSAGTVIS